MARFDWYQGTIHGLNPDEILRYLEREIDLANFRPCKGLNGYEHGYEIMRGTETVLMTVMWGGNPGVNLKGTGENAPLVAHHLRKLGAHNVTRADTCVDWIQEGLFDELAPRLMQYATDNDITINQVGDWQRGKARTLYLGSKESATRLVLYEKGYEAQGDPNWVRLEVRIRPKGSARGEVATWPPERLLEASKWLVGALESVGWANLEPQSIGTVRKATTDEQRRFHLVKQYGQVIRSWVGEAGGWNEFAEELHHAILELEEQS